MKLGVNIDHVATLRQARLAKEPDLVRAAVLAEKAGADGITIHLREDRRHIQDKDVYILREIVTTRLNLEMATSEDIIDIAVEVKPDMVTLVPEKREELTTEGGLNIQDKEVKEKTKKAIEKLHTAGIEVSLFIDARTDIMKIAKEIGAEFVEIHTGKYADAKTEEQRKEELKNIEDAVKAAKALKLKVNAGHGLDYKNVKDVVKIEDIVELNIGHSIVARSIFIGIEEAIKEMKRLIENV
ncbi:pyridoxine 5'-phosphate synthase [Hypnocyclicus thermotrophus]|uniref:Pyridoxine 5'-phosphate synthase n=1 Tax=Hypnocyclicus thermotrophus TaxID=1627895 RepID=A0AA46DXJ7_9FUSO|nr:pyridoxine 5'-phosphate synthase [Hypnocyclicus thermotrophus]TDT68537.1 pyridoxine 5'-phosphate synthase [Hypnocyclicus thermotrophus]